LVTYDINPAGVDFKLFVGRHKIGGGNNNDIVIQQPGVSEGHAILLYRENKFVLQDMLSTNGTFVNGEAIEDRVVLKNDDVIRIGSINLKLKTI
jgi:pSer/pThr/pTyr-binding forkhead associated (FHA) protein